MCQCDRTKEQVEFWENQNLNGDILYFRLYEGLSNNPNSKQLYPC